MHVIDNVCTMDAVSNEPYIQLEDFRMNDDEKSWLNVVVSNTKCVQWVFMNPHPEDMSCQRVMYNPWLVPWFPLFEQKFWKIAKYATQPKIHDKRARAIN